MIGTSPRNPRAETCFSKCHRVLCIIVRRLAGRRSAAARLVQIEVERRRPDPRACLGHLNRKTGRLGRTADRVASHRRVWVSHRRGDAESRGRSGSRLPWWRPD